VLDAADSYGGSWSSLNASDYIQLLSTRCLDQQQQQQLPKIGVNTKRLQKLPGSSQHSTHTSPIGLSPAAPTPAGARRPADQAASSASTAGAPITICLRPGGPLQNATGCALYLHPALQEGPEVKGVIIDQAPRVRAFTPSLIHHCQPSRAAIAGEIWEDLDCSFAQQQ
jgi:hypothetical protein